MAIVQVSVVDGVGFQALVPTGQELLGIELHRKIELLGWWLAWRWWAPSLGANGKSSWNGLTYNPPGQMSSSQSQISMASCAFPSAPERSSVRPSLVDSVDPDTGMVRMSDSKLKRRTNAADEGPHRIKQVN